MIRRKQWHAVPAVPLREALPKLFWGTKVHGTPVDGDDEEPFEVKIRSAGTDTAALMVYVALVFMSVKPGIDDASGPQEADGTYDALTAATHLSRKMVSSAIERLVELNLIEPVGSSQKRRYHIVSRPSEKQLEGREFHVEELWESEVPADTPKQLIPPWGRPAVQEIRSQNHPFFKLPCRAIVRGDSIYPFSNFSLRSKIEFHAMKLYLYLASVRPNNRHEALAAYETIHARIGIPERDIRRAISFLITTGLMRSVDRKSPEGKKYSTSPNLYYLKGCEDLMNRSVSAADVPTSQVHKIQ